jgi:trafficking protein particle complex subunit 5
MTAPYVPASFPNTTQSTYSLRGIASRKPSIYDRNLNRSRGLELSHSAYALLFAEMVTYAQNKVEGIAELERRLVPAPKKWSNDFRLSEMGYRVGQRVLELIVWREKNSKRETRILGILQFIHTVVWKTLFGKPADSLEKSRDNDDECTLTHVYN